MSRSYRHSGWRTDKSWANRTYDRHLHNKTFANHTVRQQNRQALIKAMKTDIDTLSIPQNMQYRKQYNSYDIQDYKFYWRKEYEGDENYYPKWKWFGK